MTAPYPYLSINSRDQWRRVAHENTTLLTDEPGFSLAWENTPLEETSDTTRRGELVSAYDPFCRLYVVNQRTGNVDVIRERHSAPRGGVAQAKPLFVRTRPAVGEFTLSAEMQTGEQADPLFSGLTVDSAGHLFLSEAAHDQMWIFDLHDHRLVSRVQLPIGSAPTDCDSDAMDVYVVTRLGLGVINLSSEFRFLDGPLNSQPFDRVSVLNGVIFVLKNANTANAKVIPWDHPELAIEAPFASDIILLDANHLVIALGPEQSFKRYLLNNADGSPRAIYDKDLRAKGYLGDGIFRTPDLRVGYHSAKGIRHALPVKPVYRTRGRVISFALDSGVHQNRWGLMFVDACIPRNCDVRVAFFVSDDDDEKFVIPRTLASNDSDSLSAFGDLLAPERSAAMPPETAFSALSEASIEDAQKLYRRGLNNELIFEDHPNSDNTVTYETPVFSEPGRFLWVMLELRGTGKVSPRVHALRVQKQGHQLLKHLPKMYSRDAAMHDYLRRYLALPEAILNEFDVSSLTRQVLLDPYSSRDEWLAWLGGFLGMSFDERFYPQTKRQLIEEAAWLFRFRGTVRGLERFIQIYADNQLGVGTAVKIVERFKFRGHAGLTDPKDPEFDAGSILGIDYRLGAGRHHQETASDTTLTDDPYAHRFTVLIASNLSTDELDIVNLIIRTHRPAHTAFDVCTVDAGMRIGRGLYLQLNSFVGQSAGFHSIHLNSGTLGRDGILGMPKTASTNTGGRVGQSARLG